MNKGLKYGFPAIAMLVASGAAVKNHLLSVQSDIRSRVFEVMASNSEAPKTVREIFEGHEVLESMVGGVTSTLIDSNGAQLDISQDIQQYVAAELLRDSYRLCDMLNTEKDGSIGNDYGVHVTTGKIGISKHLFGKYRYSLSFSKSNFPNINSH